MAWLLSNGLQIHGTWAIVSTGERRSVPGGCPLPTGAGGLYLSEGCQHVASKQQAAGLPCVVFVCPAFQIVTVRVACRPHMRWAGAWCERWFAAAPVPARSSAPPQPFGSFIAVWGSFSIDALVWETRFEASTIRPREIDQRGSLGVTLPIGDTDSEDWRNLAMGTIELMEQAIAAAESIGYGIRHEYLGGVGGGACEIGGRKWIFIDLAMSTFDQLAQVVDALRADPATLTLDLSPGLARRVGVSESGDAAQHRRAA